MSVTYRAMVVSIAAACATPPAAPLPIAPPPPRDAAVESQSDPTVDASADAWVDAPPADAGTDADASPPKEALEIFEEPGTGTCKEDADCTWTENRSDCCSIVCTARAMSVKDYKRRFGRCDNWRPQSCPLPKPCEPGSCRPKRARCNEGKCVLVCERRTIDSGWW